MTYEWEIIENLSAEDIWKWITYIDVIRGNETWKLKSFNNETKRAFIVFKCNWEWDRWQEYTAQMCNYNDLIF